MTDFRTKNVPLDWSRVLQFDVDGLSQQHPEQIDKELEDLYEVLVEAHLRPGDPQATPENLLRLFRVTQAVMENKNLYLVQAEEDIRALETRVQQQDDEMDGLMTGGDASYVAEIRTLRGDIEDLEKRNDALTRDLAEAEEQLDAERSTMREMTAQLSTERARASALEEAATRMKAEIKDYQSQIQNRKDRLQLKNMDEDQIRKQLREKNGEINRYLAEVELLSAENTRLTDEVQTMSQELEATVTELDRKESELEEIQRVIIDNDNTIDQLIDERAALQTKLEDLTQQVETVGFQDERFLTELQEEVESYKQAMRDSESDASEKAMLIQRLKGDILNLQEELKTYNVDAVSKAMSEKDDIIATLQDKLNEAYHDFELLSIDWDNIDKALYTKSEIDLDSLRSQLETANQLKEKLDAYKARHKKNLQKIRAVDAQLEEKERELIGLRERISQYEGGVYGLQEAVKEIKDLKLRLNLRDKDLLSRTQQINEWERRLGDLIDENQELRRLLGMDEKSSVDVTNVKHIRTVELEKARALNEQLQQEIDRLEEERLQLKASLRLRAMERGERAVQLGMTAEDMADVDDYAEKLRIKRGEVTSGHAPTATVIHSDQLEKLAVELERAQVDGSEARQQVKKLEDDMRRLQNDNANLEAAVKEVSRTLIQLQHSNQDNSTESLLSELNAVHKLVDILEKKQRIEKTRDLLELDAGKDVLKVNQALRDDLQSARDKIRLAQTELENLRAEIRQIREDRDHWKLEAQNPRKRAVTLPTELSMGSAEDYRALVEQLVECILELQTKDAALEQSKAALENYRDSYGMLAGRQRQLYRDYQNLKQENAEKAAALEANLRDADAAREAAQTRTEELETLVVILSAGSDELIKSSLIEVQRKLMVLKINEKALTRRYLALQEVESGLRTENERLKNDLLLLDKASRQRIGYLAASKREAKSKVQRLLSELSESVPRSEHTQLENRLNLYVAKSRQLLEKEQHWIGERIRCEEDVQRAQTLQSKMHVVELELTEAKEKLEAAHANALRLESTVVQLEKSIDERDNIIFQLRLDQKSSMRLLQKSASDLRAKLAGAVYLDKYERACERTRILEARKTEVDKNLQTLLDQKRALDDNLAETKLKLESQEELLEALRNHSASTERIAAWHSKMAALQLADLRLQRDIAREREAYHATKRELRDNVVRLAQLEEEYVSLQSEFDARQLEWEKRQGDLEATICNYEEERDRIFQAATATEFKDVVPDRSLPVGQQLETALRLLVERGRLVTAQEIKISTLEGKVRTLETQLQTNVDELYKSKSDLTHLRLEVTTKQIHETNTAHNIITAKEGVSTFDQVRDREGEAIRVAKETVASLQRQLSAKDELVEKYRKMLKDVRGEMMSHKEEYKTALQERTDTINALSDRQLERIRRPHEHSQSTANREPEADSGAIEEWEKMLAAKEQELLGLQLRMKGIEEVAEATRSDLQEKIHLLTAELDEKQNQIDGKMLELSNIRLELKEAQLKAEEPPSKKMVNLVNQLRQELEKKDAKQANLIKVIQELKQSMMQTAEEAAKMKIEESHGRADVEELVQQRTRELSDQIAELEGKGQRINKANAGERTEEQLEKSIQKLKEEVSRRDTVIANQATEIRKLQGNLKERKLQMTNSKISEARNKDPHKHQTSEEGTLGRIRDHQPRAAQALRAEEDKITDIAKERWEMEKKYQKRLETLKEKLSNKIKELEEASRTISSLRESLARTERERSRLQHKLQAASAQLAVARQLPKGQAYGEGISEELQGEEQALEHRRHLDELEKSRQQIYELETAIEQWKKRAVLQPTKETEQARHEARQLRERLQTLEELNDQLRRSRGAFSRSPEPGGINPDAKMGEKTASLVSVLESRIRDFVNKYEALETEKLKTDNDLLECRFERDEANDARMRLERRLQELEEYLSQIKEAEEKRKVAENQATIPGFTIPLTKLRSAPHLFLERSPQELVAVIQHLARSNERLRKDCESVKKYGASQSKYMEAVKEIKRLKKELGQKGEETRAVSDEMKRIARVEEENAKLLRQLRQERDKATKHFARGQELEMAKEKLHDELMQVRKTLGGIKLGTPGINEDEHSEEEKMDVEALVERLKELTKQLAERDGMIEGFLKTDNNETTNLAAENRKLSRELEMWRVRATKLTEQIASETSRSRQHVVKPGGEDATRGASPSALPRDSEELAALQNRLDQVERENAELKDELAAFDPAFFEELEDLKWNYRESVRVNLQYEEIIRDLCEKAGVSPHAVLTTVEKDDPEGGGG
ncbi:uncharacterized protein SPPG_09464 [Spizellomyces punctatus DAOM BR117]|uniref:Centrosomal protein of 290kDa coiled-coil region domain-containing protein n=1 Tax=Spizellomyces punctatus (strain DAOM BR117) TaxID=645134 RepID=A0A0L0H875_SPIPD|nr:uncharacterized protein SPPG_09464 [Spizellomyces punctatus DAOM BR117]KNC97427.1 hypothetical protein SPPG_09464 [Spizellomyces punctatus DAOM BR117]|eukprot:XP_016605467.1 hypothetical protein SPPG_09464 [Spizellomyces punctatus DAOM BR117]